MLNTGISEMKVGRSTICNDTQCRHDCSSTSVVIQYEKFTHIKRNTWPNTSINTEWYLETSIKNTSGGRVFRGPMYVTLLLSQDFQFVNANF